MSDAAEQPPAPSRPSIEPTVFALVAGLAIGLACGLIVLGGTPVVFVSMFAGVPGILLAAVLVFAVLGLTSWGLDWAITRRPGARARGFAAGAAAAIAGGASFALALEATGGYPFGVERLPFVGGLAALGTSLVLSRRLVAIVVGAVALVLVIGELVRLWDLARIPGNIPIPAGLGLG